MPAGWETSAAGNRGTLPWRIIADGGWHVQSLSRSTDENIGNFLTLPGFGRVYGPETADFACPGADFPSFQHVASPAGTLNVFSPEGYR